MTTDEHIPGVTPKEVSGIRRIVPIDIFDASVRSQRGEFVDIASLIPTSEVEGQYSFRYIIQKVFDGIATTVSSAEYAQYVQEIGNTLAGVRGQDFLFDIEGTLMNDVKNPSNMSERVYYANPWMRVVIETLMKNGNHVGFWTSASVESLAKTRKAMSLEMAVLPAIGREDYEKVVRAYQARHLNLLSDEQVLKTMQSVYPSASNETFKTGVEIFTEEILEDFDNNSTNFLRESKYPQLFISPSNGFLVDDNDMFIESATIEGWPQNRAIKCDCDPEKGNAIKVAQKIASAI